MKFRNILLGLVLVVSSVSSFAVTTVSEDSLDIKNDIIILNEEIDQKIADKIVLKIHEIQSVNKGKPIYLLLDSPGGEVVEGARIIDAMAASARPVYTVAVGTTASMAAFIHSYGVKRYMLPNSILMYHMVSGGYNGDVVRVMSRVQMAQKLNERLIKHIASVSSTTEAELNERLMKEWWVNSDEALERKLVDDVILSTAFFVPKDDGKKDDKIDFPWPFKKP